MGHFFGKKLGRPGLIRLFFFVLLRRPFFVQGRAAHLGATAGKRKKEEEQGRNP
jgi:hypothetical protein